MPFEYTYGTKKEVYYGVAKRVGNGHKNKDGSIRYKFNGRPDYTGGRLIKGDIIRLETKEGYSRYVSRKKHEAGNKLWKNLSTTNRKKMQRGKIKQQPRRKKFSA